MNVKVFRVNAIIGSKCHGFFWTLYLKMGIQDGDFSVGLCGLAVGYLLLKSQRVF